MTITQNFTSSDILDLNSKIKIFSHGSFLPSQILKSDHIFEEIKSDKNYGTPCNWMSDRMGILERRVSSADCNPSELAIPACEQALSHADGINLDDIGMVIFTGIENDQPEPATAHVIQKKIGLKAKYAFDLSNACYGFMNGIQMAEKFILSGEIKYALVCTGETPSKVLYSIVDELKSGVCIKEFRNKLGGLSVGDAGGAFLIGLSSNESGFNAFNTISDSEHLEKCIYRWNQDGTINGQMRMGPIVNAIVREQRKIFQHTLDKLGWDNFDWMLCHQMGAKPFEKFRDISGISEEKIIKTYPKLGNITSATLPVAYAKLVDNGLVSSGDKVGGFFAGSGLVNGQFGMTY